MSQTTLSNRTNLSIDFAYKTIVLTNNTNVEAVIRGTIKSNESIKVPINFILGQTLIFTNYPNATFYGPTTTSKNLFIVSFQNNVFTTNEIDPLKSIIIPAESPLISANISTGKVLTTLSGTVSNPIIKVVPVEQISPTPVVPIPESISPIPVVPVEQISPIPVVPVEPVILIPTTPEQSYFLIILLSLFVLFVLFVLFFFKKKLRKS